MNKFCWLKVVTAIFFVSQTVLGICNKANFADVNCSNYSFLITFDQSCFDHHWNRGDAWNENIVFGSSGESSCEFNVAEQGANTIESNVVFEYFFKG